MKKNNPFRELFYRSLKRILLIMRIATILLIFGIVQAHATDAYSQKTRLSLAPDYLTKVPEIQQSTVKGTVTDENGNPFPGVNVMIEGTTIGSITDISGKYSVDKANENIVLIFSFIGYTTQRIPASSKTIIDVKLVPDVKALEEVVVVGYGTQKKINLTGAVDQITLESVQDISVPNISRGLQGLIPNLNITFRDGRPSTSPAYNIRGLTSIGAGGSALILVDGVEGDPRTINPKDIESVSVLKDAASASIYGSRGVFGVVLITTKKPEKEPKLSYSANYSVNNRTAQRDVILDSYLWAKMYEESYYNIYRGTRSATTVGTIGINFSSDLVAELKYRSENPNHGRPDAIPNPGTNHYWYYGETDWWKLLYKENLPSMEHSLLASGGSDKASYSISGRYYTQEGLYNIRSDKYNTYDIRMQGSVRPLEWLNISSNLSYSAYDYTDPFSGGNIWEQMYIRCGATPFAIPYNPDGTLTQAGSVSIGILEGKSYQENKQGQVLINTGFDASIIKNILSLKGDFSFRNRVISTNQKFVPVPYSNYPGVITLVGDSRLYDNKNYLNYYAYNLYGDFKHNIGDHALKILGGTNIEISNTRFLNINRAQLLIEDLDAFNLATGTDFNISGSGSDWANAGIFARLNYVYKEKYLLEINSRYDGSSNFPKAKQFGFFPSVSVGWRISEEKFLAGTRGWLDNLKPRFSYGSLGNSQISPYLYIEQIKASKTTKVLQGQRPVVTRNPAVLPDDFTWETSTTIDFGLDFDMLNYRMGVVFDWYKRTTTDMITAGPVLPSVFGAASPRGNYADLETKGFEFTLKWADQIKTAKPITYGIRLTLADNVSYITKFNNPQGTLTIDPDLRTASYYEGMRVGDYWGLTTLGLFVDDADIQSHASQSFIMHNLAGLPAQAGDVKFKDLNNDNKIDWGTRTISDPGDLSIIGNSAPRYTYGIGLNAEYSNFSLSAFFQGVGKRDWYPAHHQNPFWGPYGFWAAEIPTHFLGTSYTNDNPDPNAYWPLWKGNMAYGNRHLQTQTRYLQNTAYIRLKDLTLSYSLPKHIAQDLKMKELRFSLTGQNIWTYSPVFKISKDIDIEQMDANVGTYYPMLKSYSFGVNVTF